MDVDSRGARYSSMVAGRDAVACPPCVRMLHSPRRCRLPRTCVCGARACRGIYDALRSLAARRSLLAAASCPCA
ncbi:hypothetical protein EON62_02905 [archaeon]|nr:MAG: hypothetical protein EON62_02905 [archaeon]